MRSILILLLSISLLMILFPLETEGQTGLVRIGNKDGSWYLEVDDKEFYIKGAVGNSYLERVKEYGGNSIRSGWQKEQLDKLHGLGLKVLVNLPAKAERDGMDYNDTSEIRKQTESIVAIVQQTKDHPAVLMWAIGNELDYIPPYEPFNPAVWDAVNQAARAIHAVDPNHPVMTVIGTSMMHKVADIVSRCPDIDLLGINSYGDIYTLQDTLIKYGWIKPYVITEWGPDGYWEVRKTPWGAPYEQTGLEKYLCYEKKYLRAISPENKQCLGSFVFYWSGFKQETTHTWFCMFDENGLESPMVGLMHYLWTGQGKSNLAPLVDSMNFENRTCYQTVAFNPGSIQQARVFAHDPDDDALIYIWEIRPEAEYAAYAGQGEKVPESLPGLIREDHSLNKDNTFIRFNSPASSGPYRLFVYAYDNHGHFSTANLPFFVLPVTSDTADLGRYTSRTMSLLHHSTPQKRNTVKILVYGQSISAQDWWFEVKKSVKERFPYANLIMENKSIGGFSTQILYKTVEMDISSFYPDLVLLHVYGDQRYYDTILHTIRSRTASEIAIMTDHYTGINAWSDTMSYYLLPALAEKYKCDIINIRDPWKKLIADRQMEPSRLLTDDVHLNDYGNFLMAELVKPLFYFRSRFPPDPFGLVKVYKNGSDFKFIEDTLTLSFSGNRMEIVPEGISGMKYDPFKVLLDDKAPSDFQGTYFMSRPYNSSGDEWPWKLPGMIRIQHTRPWIEEEWTCTFTDLKEPYTDFGFTITGSVTGQDGKGTAGKDFISYSQRVIILAGDAEQGGDWHLSRSFEVLQTRLSKGDMIKWKTYSISMDSYIPQIAADKMCESSTTLFQGIPNTTHTLKLVKTGRNVPVIETIRVYNPFWKIY